MIIPDSYGAGVRENQADLAKRFGIDRFERTQAHHTVRTIGFSPRTGKWYGGSHRAVAGFKVGDVVKRGDVVCTATGGAYDEGFQAKTEADAKALAANFADQVS